jgi:hypothetical protein
MIPIKTFRLIRDEDVSGVSGTGVVAVGAEFPTGRCIIEWLPGRFDVRSLNIYQNAGEIEQINGHDGATRIVWDGSPT